MLAVPGLVLAHAELETATPADKSTVTEPVAEVSGVYSQAMKPDGSSLVVKDASGTQVAKGGVDPADDTRMVATPATPLGDGTYLVESTTLATDGDVAHATWTFTVAITASAAPTASPTATASAEASATASPTTAPTPSAVAPTAAPSPFGRRHRRRERQRRDHPDHRGPARPDRRRRLPADPAKSTRRAGRDAASRATGATRATRVTRAAGRADDHDDHDTPTRPDVTRERRRSLAARLSGAVAAALGFAFLLPATVAAHTLNATYASRLPLAVYLVGAAATVALSFIFVIVRDVRAQPPDLTAEGTLPPAWLRIALRAIGLFGWAWIIAQGIAGGSSDGDVATLFLWVYGWVGLAIICAIVGPAWQFLDPFSTLHDLGAAVLRALHVQGWAIADYPERVGRWPAVAGFAFFVWLELVVVAGPSTLFIVVVGYTALTLAMMAQFGRDEWRSHGETFTVWFRTLGRLAYWRLVDEDGRVARRSFGSGLLEPGWSRADVTLVALGVSSIIFDGLSQTQPFFDLFGAPGIAVKTLLLFAWLGIVVGLAFAVATTVGLGAIGAGLLPIALGYLIAHYLTYLLIDGQRILIAISDPFQKGWDLFGTAFHTPSGAWLPPGLVWTVQLAAVVGGHMLGAWGGHVVAAADAPAGISASALRRRQIPLAVVMVGLTTLTLWSSARRSW